MKHIPVRNAHQAVPWLLKEGGAKDLQGPVIIEICKPQEAVVFWPQLALNPFVMFQTAMTLVVKGGLPMVTPQFVIKEVRGVVEATIFGHDGNALIYTAVCVLQQVMAQLHGKKTGHVWVVVASPTFDEGLVETVGRLSHAQITKADLYAQGMHKTVDYVSGDKEQWLREVRDRMEGPAMGFQSWFVRRVMSPILDVAEEVAASEDGNRKDVAERGIKTLRPVAFTDWQFACEQFLVRWGGL